MSINEIARKMMSGNKGLLAADESSGTIKKRFESVGIDDSEENRKRYREMLFTTDGIEEFISGVILYDETILQTSSDGRPFPELLSEKGILPGIKVDMGKVPMPGSTDEFVTEGLDGLRDRLKEYKEMGAMFTKWRAAINIDDGLPTKAAIHANANSLARYAAFVQEAGMVPIVEPEVLMDGDHDIEQCAIVTTLVLDEVFEELFIAKVDLKGMILKPNMVVSGKDSEAKADAEVVSELTMQVFRKSVPADVAGIAFLSGGQSQTEATKNLCEINREKKGEHPWPLTFSFSRALQNKPMEIWKGDDANKDAAQKAFYEAAKADAEARRGVC